MTEPARPHERAVLRLAGVDRHTFLQGLISQDIDALTSSAAIFATLLTPQGKILFDFFIADTGKEFLIDCHKEFSAALMKRLTLYKLRANVTIDLDEQAAVVTSPDEISSNGAVAFADPRLAGLGWRSIGSGAQKSSEAYHARRIALGVPEFGADFGADEMFLLDVNYDALNAVSYQKGCFVGQEVTSRMKRKGEARKRTLIATFEGPRPTKGAAIKAEDSTLGEILSAASGAALAFIRVDRLEKAKATGAPVTCEGIALNLRLPGYLEQA